MVFTGHPLHFDTPSGRTNMTQTGVNQKECRPVISNPETPYNAQSLPVEV